MATYIIEVEVDGIGEDAELVIQNMANAMTNIIYNNGLTETIKVSCAYKLDEESSSIVSEGDLIYP